VRWLILNHHDTNYNELADLTVSNHTAYCKKHGYDYSMRVCSRSGGGIYDNMDHQMLLYFLPFYDAVMTIGTDILFMNQDIALDDIFPISFDQQICDEHIGGSAYNNDVMLWRNAPSTFVLINEIISKKSEYEKYALKWQQHICDLIRAINPLISKMNRVDEHVMNTYPDHWKDGDFILHCYFKNLEEKIKITKEFIEGVKL
jgi:hypothetical protein